MNEIAIASVPVQAWEQPYEVSEALRQGTIFPSLYKPFYVLEDMPAPEALPKSDCESLLHQIQEVSFALIDITLYLDTHQDDRDALAYREQARLKRKELMQKFADQYYPLTQDCEGLWSDGPIPWEGAC